MLMPSESVDFMNDINEAPVMVPPWYSYEGIKFRDLEQFYDDIKRDINLDIYIR
jgi:hypothetical protein